MKIYIAGHKGLIGSALTRFIDRTRNHSWIGQTRLELNLLNRNAVFNFVEKSAPDAIILSAAKVGGIKANFDQPVEFLSENLQIQSNVLDAAHKFNVNRVLFLGSSCIYPKFAKQPISESELLTGPLEPTNEAMAIAKIAGLKLVEAYRREYDRNWITAMPTNVYGPNDNFDYNSSHVLPALIRKFHDAKENQKPYLSLWGTGQAMREFIHSDDLAAALLLILESYDDPAPINVGSGQELSIKDLADLISKIVGYNGKVIWDSSMPDGTPRKALNNSRLESLGWEPKITLEDGIRSTYNWFRSNLS